MPTLNSILNNVFGSSNERKLKKFQSQVIEINQLETVYVKLSDESLKNKVAFLPMVQSSTSTLSDCKAAIFFNRLLNKLVFKPPHRPLSDEITIKQAFFGVLSW